jgi:hypothetical protein
VDRILPALCSHLRLGSDYLPQIQIEMTDIASRV